MERVRVRRHEPLQLVEPVQDEVDLGVADIGAYMLAVNGFPAGETNLPRRTSQLDRIRVQAIKP